MKTLNNKVVKSSSTGFSSNLYVLEKPGTKQIVRRRRRRKLPAYIKLFLMSLGIYLVFSFLLGGYQIWQLKTQYNALKERQQILLEEQEILKKELESLNDPEIIERIARESLGMVRPGESIVLPAIPEENIPKPKDVKPEDIQD